MRRIIKTVSDDKKPMKEWDWEKNTQSGFHPDKIAYRSHKKVWWICEKGHSWEAIVANRTKPDKPRGCPYCRSGKVITGVNDFATLYPELLKEWDYEKNKGVDPAQISPGSHHQYWWICKNCHKSWKTPLKVRTQMGCNCRDCSMGIVTPGVNDLATTNPRVAAMWDYSKNDILPSQVAKTSYRKVWWICKNGHSFEGAIYGRNTGSCPICSKRRRTSFPEQAIYFYVKRCFPDAINSYKDIFSVKGMELDIYIPSIKVGIEYDGVRFHSSDKNRLRDAKKYQICRKNGIVLIRIKNDIASDLLIKQDYYLLTTGEDDTSLTNAINELLYRLGQKPNANVKSDRLRILEYMDAIDINLVEKFPDIASEWNHEKNGGLKPEYFHPGSNEKVWWLCKTCGHEWKTSISERTGTDHTGCPICSKTTGAIKKRKTHLERLGSISKTNPEYLEYWDFEKNKESPDDVHSGQTEKFYWLCKKCGYSWSGPLPHKNRNGVSCPCCNNRVCVTGVNDLQTKCPELAKEWDFENNKLKPSEVKPGTPKKAHWICSKCGFKWEASINSRVRGAGCSRCYHESMKKR